MGRSIRGVIPVYYPLLYAPANDMERMGRESLRLYLQRRLDHLEDQILSLTQEYDDLMSRGLAARCMEGEVRESEIWQDILELDYLHATREAIQRTLDSL
jgi:hypothetical protein